MKWIGQHIYDLASRFRNDVFLEDISTGTIASGAHLGLDSSNKIVKAVDGGGDLTSIVAGTGLSGTSLTGPIPTLNVDAAQTHITSIGTIAAGIWNGTAITSAYLDADTAHLTTAQTFTGSKTMGTSVKLNFRDANSYIHSRTANDLDIFATDIVLDAATSVKIETSDLTMYDPVNDGNPTISLGSSATDRLEIKSTYNSGTQKLCDIDFTTFTSSASGNDGRFNWYVDEVQMAALNDNDLIVYGGILAVDEGASITSYNTTASSATQGGKIRLRCDDGAAMGDDHRLGVIEFEGAEDDANNRIVGASIQAMCDAAWSASDNSTRLEFYTTVGDASSELSLTLGSDKLATFTGEVKVVNKTTSSATEGGRLTLECDDGAAMGDDHRLGVIEFSGAEDASNNRQTGAKIQAMCDAGWSASENGTRLEFYTMDGNASSAASSELSLTLDSNLLATFAGGVTVTGTITGDVTGDLTGEADTVATIAGLAPNTATTQATQAAITTCANLVTVGTIGTGVWQGTTIKTAYIGDDQVTEDKLANTLLAKIDANVAKATNVTTNLTATTHASQITINSSDGTNVIVAEASGSIAGVMSVTHHDKLDAIEASATADQSKSDIDGLAITTVGTIDTGVWNGTAIADAYLGANTAHLSGTQTFTGTKQFNSFKLGTAPTMNSIFDEDAMGSNSATGLATQQSIKAYVDAKKHVTHYQVTGNANDTDGEYMISKLITANTAPFVHDQAIGSDGTDSQSVTIWMRSGGHVMPNACTLTRFTGWVASNGSANNQIALFRVRLSDGSDSDPSAVLLNEHTEAGSGNQVADFFNITAASASQSLDLAAGDIVFSAVKGDASNIYFNATFEVEL